MNEWRMMYLLYFMVHTLWLPKKNSNSPRLTRLDSTRLDVWGFYFLTMWMKWMMRVVLTVTCVTVWRWDGMDGWPVVCLFCWFVGLFWCLAAWPDWCHAADVVVAAQRDSKRNNPKKKDTVFNVKSRTGWRDVTLTKHIIGQLSLSFT